MNAIRITTHLESETLYLPELGPLVGKDVEIIVLEDLGARKDEPVQAERPLQGSVLVYDDPFDPVVEGDWEALQ